MVTDIVAIIGWISIAPSRGIEGES